MNIRKDNEIIEIENTLILSAMRPTGLGCNNITPRFMRHFNIISIESFTDDEMRTIFKPIIENHFLRCAFPQEYFKYTEVLIWII